MDPDMRALFHDDAERELEENIVPFWLAHARDDRYGGFIGRMANDLTVEEKAPKGLVLNARLLWTFSALYRRKQEPEYLGMASRAMEYLTRYFQDTRYGGYFWMLDTLGRPLDEQKKVYGQAFVLYALSEFALAARDRRALDQAVNLYRTIEKYCWDAQYTGYFEAFNRDWTPAGHSRLSEKDMDEKKSMNSHLHLLEAYIGLSRVWQDERLKASLGALVGIFMKRIIDPKISCFRLFFDEKWNPKTDRISFGHDIEGSWLLTEASERLGEPALVQEIRRLVVRMAHSVRMFGMDPEGGLVNEGTSTRVTDDSRHWWAQAEAVVGFINAYEISNDPGDLDTAYRCWLFIQKFFIDREHGDWFWKVSKDGKPDLREYKISEWKCPYHTVRACLEIMRRLDAIGSGKSL